MDDLIEALLKGLGSVLRFFVQGFLIEILFFNLGRGTLLIITMARYPRTEHLDTKQNYISVFGFLVFVLAIFCIGLYNESVGV